ncbi:TPA: hypothetical protein DEP21_05460 [Patescibacteria group bacterium]|nr:hypothetical protein [Candidatus Gracilibacteria bacterium]
MGKVIIGYFISDESVESGFVFTKNIVNVYEHLMKFGSYLLRNKGTKQVKGKFVVKIEVSESDTWSRGNGMFNIKRNATVLKSISVADFNSQKEFDQNQLEKNAHQ